MSKSGKKNEAAGDHVAKADVRHRYKITEFADFTRREVKPDGTEKLMPRVAVLSPMNGGKQVRAYVPGNLDEPVEVGSVVMCRPHDKPNKGDGPPVKFRITNVVGAGSGSGSGSDTLSAAQNAQLAGATEARAMEPSQAARQ
jgi:ribosomal protein S12